MPFNSEEDRQLRANEQNETNSRISKQRAELEQLKAQQAQQQVLAQEAAAAEAASQKDERQAAIELAGNEAQPQQREEGFVTQIGEALGYAVDANGLTADVLNGLAAGANQVSGGNLQGVDDFFQSSGERQQSAELFADERNRRRQEGDMSGLEQFADTTVNTLEGVATGIEAGVALPFTIAGRVLNQDTPWADAPEVLKHSPVGKTVFEITQIVVPTLLTGGVAGAAGAPASLSTGAVALIGESVLETATQDSFDDLVFGRQAAVKFGELAESLGYDGAQFTTDLIEGKKPSAQAWTAIVGTFQNLGINWGADKVLRAITSKFGGSKVSEAAESTAQVLGRDSTEVQKALDDVQTPNYNRLEEPHESINVDTDVPVARPSQANEAVSDEALVAESIRRNAGIGEDGLTGADRSYFTNWSAIAEEEGVQRALMEATSTLKRLKEFPDDMRGVLDRANDWWTTNRSLLGGVDSFTFDDIDQLAKNFRGEMTTRGSKPLPDSQTTVPFKELNALKKDLPGNLNVQKRDPKGKFIKGGDLGALSVSLREFNIVNEEGFIAAAMIGEELGIRLQRLARIAVNLDSSAAQPIDFTKAVENFLDLSDKSSLFLVPLRRAKRKWAVEGIAQQRRTIKGIQDADIQQAIKTKQPASADAPAREFLTVTKDEESIENTLRELWSAYKAGDKDAGNTIKAYLNTIAYVDPKMAVSQIDNLSRVLQQQIKQGNTEATQQLYYAYMLTRVRPQIGSLASNIARLVADPLGAVMSGEVAYGMGQLVGGVTALGDGFQAAARAYKANRSIIGGSKIDAEVQNLALRQAKEESLYQGIKKSLAADNASAAVRFGHHVNHLRRVMSNHPLTHSANRLLTAQDEMAKVVFASQVATGRAFQDASSNGIKGWQNINLIVDKHLSEIFEDGVRTGKITQGDVLEAAKHLTFQGDIPQSGNFVDNLFLGMKTATDNSAVWKFFSPFTRLGYNTLEAAGRTLAGSVPGGSAALQAMVPRYQKIMAGEYGEALRLQLKSQFAFGQSLSIGATFLAFNGYMTGNNSGKMPRRSFIVPSNNAQGWVAIPYEKLEPFSTPLSLFADLVQGLKEEVISQGQYDRFLQEMIFSLGMSTTDKSFRSGLVNLAQILDMKNFGDGTIKALAGAGSTAVASQVTGPFGGLARMISDWAQPYQTISTEQDNPFATGWASIMKRLAGGVSLPVLHDELTGLPIPKTRSLTDPNDYWGAVAAGMINEVTFPGRVTSARKGDKVVEMLTKLNFERDAFSSLRTFEGIPLSLEEQSILSKDMNDFGQLNNRLETYFESGRFKSLLQKFNSLKSKSPTGNTSEGTPGHEMLTRIHADIRHHYTEAKEAAVRGRLLKRPDFVRKYQSAKSIGYDGPVDGSSASSDLMNMFK